MKTIFKNAVIVSEDFKNGAARDVLVENGSISRISECIPDSAELIINANGQFLLPGFVDMECDICEPGFENKEDIVSASLAAANGGFTSITASPNSVPVVDNKTVVQYIIARTREAFVNIYPYGSMTVGMREQEIAEIGEMKQAGVKAVTDGGKTIADADLMRNIFSYSKMLKLPVITHCEDLSLRGRGVINEGFMSTQIGLIGIPREAEEIIVARNLVLCAHTGANMHIANVTTKGALALIKEAKARGVGVTCGTSPHYFMLTEQEVSDYNTLAKVNPPLRTKEDTKAIIEAIFDGTIDVITSGHSPATREGKSTEFENAEYGISTLDIAFTLCCESLVHQNGMKVYSLVEKLSQNPSAILGLEKKGRIAVGSDADMILVNFDEPVTIEADSFYSKAKFTPFQHKKMKGAVLNTFVAGYEVFTKN